MNKPTPLLNTNIAGCGVLTLAGRPAPRAAYCRASNESGSGSKPCQPDPMMQIMVGRSTQGNKPAGVIQLAFARAVNGIGSALVGELPVVHTSPPQMARREDTAFPVSATRHVKLRV